MTITSELEKLTALKDRGDLTKEEFEKAKALLLSNQEADGSSSGTKSSKPDSNLEKDTKNYRIVAYLSTITVCLSAISAIIAPSTMNVVILILFVIACVLGWVKYNSLRGKQS